MPDINIHPYVHYALVLIVLLLSYLTLFNHIIFLVPLVSVGIMIIGFVFENVGVMTRVPYEVDASDHFLD